MYYLSQSYFTWKCFLDSNVGACCSTVKARLFLAGLTQGLLLARTDHLMLHPHCKSSKGSLTNGHEEEWQAQRRVQGQRHFTLRCWSNASIPALLSKSQERCPWDRGACLKEGCVVREYSSVSLLLLPSEGCPRHATCHHMETVPLTFHVSPLHTEKSKDVFLISMMDNITT